MVQCADPSRLRKRTGGKAGAKNAAILSVQILALADSKLSKKLADFKKAQEKR
jgi:phosphoribosylcarboxyaminoimidazole (NCAIR) mutase